MARKFIPNGDVAFVTMAENFARGVAADAERLAVCRADADALATAVTDYRAALDACRVGTRSAVATRVKDDARGAAERIVRRLAHAIRANPRVDAGTKVSLGLRERTARARHVPCPQEPPRLKFVRALHEGNGATPMHELAFSPLALFTTGKPAGAVRLELFVDLVPPEEPVPTRPAASATSRPWYLRSYTRSPIRLVPPIARVPMRVVYWGRWADSTGHVGPFGATVVGWIEGGSGYLPAPARGGHKPVPILDDAADGAAGRDRKYVVAMLEAQSQWMNPHAAPALPEPAATRTRQLEGPATEAA